MLLRGYVRQGRLKEKFVRQDNKVRPITRFRSEIVLIEMLEYTHKLRSG